MNRTINAVASFAITVVLGSTALIAGVENTKAADDINVGILLPLTGAVAPIGINNRRGHELAIDEINAAGGIKALDGAKLVIIDGDTQGNPNTGISEVEKLAERGVVAIMGAYQSGVTFPVTQISERLGVPFIDPVAVADSITDGRGFKYTFKIAPKASWYARDQIRFLVDLGKLTGSPIKTVALLHEDTLFGTSSAEGQLANAEQAGMEVLADISYPKDSPDMTSVLAQIKSLKPDALILVSYINDAVLIAKTMSELQMDMTVIGTSAGHIDPAYVASLGKSAEGTLTVGEWNPDLQKKGVSEIAARFKEKFGVDMNGHSAETYMATMVLRDALERAGSTDREAVAAALRETKICGDANIMSYDCIEFGEDGQSPGAELVVLQIQDGTYKTVWPTNIASMEVKTGGM